MRWRRGMLTRCWRTSMDKLTAIPPALSIRQPWLDLIMRAEKTIEVRDWSSNHRGPILLHASRTLDWKTIELFGYEDALALPRGALIGVADVVDMVELTAETWAALRRHHLVIHPATTGRVRGFVLREICAFSRPIPCRGRTMLFPVMPHAIDPVKRELATLGLLATP
jgi:hypothetical protein